MIKVLNIISDTNIGGAGKVLINYAKYRDRADFDMSAAVPVGSMLIEPLKEQDVTVYEVDAMADASFDRKAIGKLKLLIRDVDPDIVHTHGSLSGRIAAKQCGKKIIYTRHCAFPIKGYMKHGPGKWANYLINMHYTDRIIAVGDATRDNLVESGIPAKYIDTMMNGTEPVILPSEEECLQIRKSYGISADDFVVGIMARIEIYKGHDDILDAVASLAAEGRKIKLAVAGTGTYEDTFKARVSEMVAEKKLPEGTVIFAGFISKIERILAIMDVQVNASFESEASSLSIIEGMSAGIPSVVSDCGGNPALIEDGENGYVFPARDTGALADCLRALADDKALADRLRAGSKRIYEEKFTGKIFAENIENVYRNLVNRK